MRLHVLEVTAFGPFPGAERVNFDALAAGGLFLLHGRTGAGKSSVLDAVCYALYGVVPGMRQKSARLRSDHAPPDLRTSVRLELTMRGRRLEVVREPAWDRPKRRGAGTTTDPARSTVRERCGEGWETLATRTDEVGHLVRELAGMSADQFCQVALLPQGQFAEFLRSDAEARRPILEQLFDTRRFSAVEAWLGDRRREGAMTVAAAQARVAELLARVEEAAGGADPVAGVQPGQLLAAAAERARAAAADHREAAAAFAAARAHQDDARALHERQQRHRGAQQRQAAVVAAAPRRAGLATEVTLARRAGAVLPAVGAARRAREEQAAAREAVARAQRDLPAVPAPEGRPGHPVPERLVADLRAEIVRLEAAVGNERAAARLQREARQTAAERAAVAARLRSLEREGAAALERRDAARAASEPAAAAVEVLDARVCAARRRDDLAGRLASAHAVLVRVVGEAQQARQDWLDLRQSRLEGMAAELAGRLVAGDPCRVCGSAEHPAPAPAAAGAVSEQDERVAQLRHQERETAREAAEHEVAALQAARAAARAEAGGDVPVAGLADALATAQARLTALEATAADCAGHAAAAEALDSRVARHQEERRDLEVRRGALDTRRAELGRRREELLATVAAARGADTSLAARRERLVATADAAERLGRAREALARADAAADGAGRAAEEAARAAGFAGVAAAAAAAREEAALERLAAELAGLTAEAAAVADLLTDPTLAAAAAAPPADLLGAAARTAAAQRGLERAAAAAAAAEHTVAALRRLVTALDAALDELRPAQQRHAVVDGLSRLAEGTGADNAKRMRLSAYVLAARLEQVAAAASERLVRMSGGRYTLVHTDEGAGRGRAGLGLRVVDAWTGVERDTTTLSGGESFFASLALALGLADVVTAEAGGASIDTLFVDEGFGSLDEDTLDEVMDVLDGLRAGGRVVGVVSHVPELRQRIPTQLHVHKGRRGSTVTVPGRAAVVDPT